MSRLNDSADGLGTSNRLIYETSPYLLQHAHNPVDWYPWGEEAFAKAKAEDKPVLLSVGYAACHWCHVMAHESFENAEIAQLMNRHFVCIKVDREERPDVDALYMDAVQALTSHGGWPMTVFLTPDGAPFYGGTYFPPRDRYGMAGFPTVLQRLAEYYATHRDDIEQQASAFRDFYRQQATRKLELPAGIDLATATADPQNLDDAADRLLAQMDAIHGGFGRAPKFPHPMALDFLLRVEQRRRELGAQMQGEPRLMGLVRLTLDKMAGGGMYDQVGGGFHRYSTDETWLVPHFEKMLYDNALLARTYLATWQLTGDQSYRRTCEETLDYVLREMTDDAGGFFATQDADSEGTEGKFYVWSLDDLREVLSASDLTFATRLWDITDHGNFEGHNIPHVTRPLAETARELGISDEEAYDTLARVRAVLYDRRAQRVWPARDDKVIVAWNGLMLRAMADASRALGRKDYQRAMEANASFLLRELIVDGRLRRTWRQGQAKIDAYLEDYAALANGLLSTYEATGESRWFVAARQLADEMLVRFWDDGTGSFFDSANDQEQLIGRPRELTDNATPSGTSLAAESLLRLAAFTGEARYYEHAARVVLALAPVMVDQPSAFGYLLGVLDDLIGPLREIAIVGALSDAGTQALLAVVNQHYLPRSVLAVADFALPGDAEVVPLLSGRMPLDGHATAFVCQGFACQVPVTDSDALRSQLLIAGQ